MRCRGCNKTLKSKEIIWYPRDHKYEDLCITGRRHVFNNLLETDFNVERIGMYIDDALGEYDDDEKVPEEK
jgi:hypothetical protein